MNRHAIEPGHLGIMSQPRHVKPSSKPARLVRGSAHGAWNSDASADQLAVTWQPKRA
jgi:hypothetical protein